ncbi:hypothetical protein [Helicobacter cappadocius]|uniref:Baseplate assembly protein n=1 Tax=Helicobacter cappadocius TaxID=3063998 RepID=A0AA90TFL3_9HELI|nr:MULTISPECIES: hypothetical protein [unclassified Helicobacter]MDO7253904.1 hypothetical protein [Helicobacter sp. faydin-H75]MDP2539765.1 hypothetical protein [Helicobacter sp. faydin-H76]
MFGEVKIYIGSVIETKGNQIKVDILGTKTEFITYIGGFSKFNSHFIPPVVGELVMVISFLESNLYLALSLPSPNIHSDSNTEFITYDDGTKISYDANKSELNINAVKNITIICKNASITADSVDLGNSSGAGVVTTQCICPFTGSPHAQGSTKVRACL